MENFESLLENVIIRKVYKLKKNKKGTIKKTPKGIILAGVLKGTNKVVLGYSMCHHKDKWNQPGGRPKKNHGKYMAMKRAIRWNIKYNNDTSFKINVPFGIYHDMKEFLNRCDKYYKDKVFDFALDMKDKVIVHG